MLLIWWRLYFPEMLIYLDTTIWLVKILTRSSDHELNQFCVTMSDLFMAIMSLITIKSCDTKLLCQEPDITFIELILGSQLASLSIFYIRNNNFLVGISLFLIGVTVT